jgi:hypothetical protein
MLRSWFLAARRAAPALATVAGVAPLAAAQSGAGPDFKHFVNGEFDFHIAGPKAWSCTGCREEAAPPDVAGKATSEQEEVWRFAAPEGTTWLEVTFISGFPADRQSQLLEKIQPRHPDVQHWFDIDRGAFDIGYTSNGSGEQGESAWEYYLVAKYQVVRLHWVKDPHLETRAVQLDAIKDSIDRASLPPRVRSIRSVPTEGAIRPGDRACIEVGVDDLRDGYTDAGLIELTVEGAPEHYSMKSVRYLAERGAYEVCFNVTTAFGPTGLRVVRLAIETSEMHEINCSRPTAGGGDYRLECRGSSDWRTGRPPTVIVPEIAPVANDNPDQDGPAVQVVHYEPRLGVLEIVATDPAGVMLAELRRGDDSFVIYADQLERPMPIDPSRFLRRGWNTIDTIVFYDRNGLPTMLRQRPGDIGTDDQGPRYERVPWIGEPEMTTIPVVSIFKTGGTR